MPSRAVAPILLLVSLLCCVGLLSARGGQSAVDLTPTVTVFVDDEALEVRTPAATVAEVLAEQEVVLGDLDRTDPSPDTPVIDDMHIRVTRVTRRDQMEETPLPARTIVLADPDRLPGFFDTLSEGRDGHARRVWRIWERDGEVTVRTLLSEEILEQPEDTILLRGVRGLPTPGGDWRLPMHMEATAYEPGPRSCGRWASGYTAIGLKAEKGVVAVDDTVIPIRSRLYIPGYGFAIAGDRGSAIKGMRIDLCFATYEEAINFGRQPVKVYRLD